MKTTIENIFNTLEDKNVVLATLIPIGKETHREVVKRRIWKHLIANIQYLNLEYTTIDLYSDTQPTIHSFLVIHELSDNRLTNKLKELESENSILAFAALDTTKVKGKSLQVNFKNRNCKYYIHLDDAVDKPYNYYNVTNWLGKMAVANGAKKSWRDV